ncbi:MAG: ribosome maturation factor RimP [Firmicutes bacterium]|nr:ribosome maturation factor RimP [Candidatus Fermentithermobacillaceae bacterium]
MSRKQLLEGLFEAFEPEVRAAGLELLDVELTSDENRKTILRVTIYSPNGVTLDDCVNVETIISPMLDEMDPIAGSYNLEISSPGLERVLKRDKEYEIFGGRLCRVNLYGPIDGKRMFEGLLVGLDYSEGESRVTILTESGQMSFSRQNISKVQLVYQEKLS